VADAALAVARAVQGLGRDGDCGTSIGWRAACAGRAGAAAGPTDITVEEMETTVETTTRRCSRNRTSQSTSLDFDLTDIFGLKRKKKGRAPRRPAQGEPQGLIDKVTYWTGVQRPLVKRLVESIETRVSKLGLRAAVRSERKT
jgi:hypothetical protein